MSGDKRESGSGLAGVGFSIVSKLKGQVNLGLHAFARFALQSFSEEGRLLKKEFAIEQIERLQGCGAAHAFGCDLAAVRAVKSAESGILLHADFGHVNHATPFGRAEVFPRVVNADIVIVRLENSEARAAARCEIEFATDSEDRIAKRFCIQIPVSAVSRG